MFTNPSQLAYLVYKGSLDKFATGSATVAFIAAEAAG